MCLRFICQTEEIFRKQPHKNDFQLLFTSSILEWSEEFLGQNMASVQEASVSWDKSACQASRVSLSF